MWLVIGLVTSITALWQEQVHTRIRERAIAIEKAANGVSDLSAG
jgi:hypothetical protein